MSIYEERPPFPYFGNDNSYGRPSYAPARERNDDPAEYKPYLDSPKESSAYPFYGAGGKARNDGFDGGSRNWPMGPPASAGPAGGGGGEGGAKGGWFPNFDWNYDDFVKKFMGNQNKGEEAPPGPEIDEPEPAANNIFDRYKSAFGPTNGGYSNDAPYYPANGGNDDNFDPFKDDDTYAKNCTLPYNPGESRYPSYYH